MKKAFILGFICFFSGALSAYFIDPYSKFYFFFFPGIIFGIACAPYALLYRDRWWRHVMALIWIGASTGSYYVAVRSAMQFVGKGIESLAVPFFVGGVVGGLLVSISWYVFIKKIRPLFIIELTLLSAVLGMLPTMLPEHGSFNPVRMLFVVWQCLMGVGLGFATYYTKPMPFRFVWRKKDLTEIL